MRQGDDALNWSRSVVGGQPTFTLTAGGGDGTYAIGFDAPPTLGDPGGFRQLDLDAGRVFTFSSGLLNGATVFAFEAPSDHFGFGFGDDIPPTQYVLQLGGAPLDFDSHAVRLELLEAIEDGTGLETSSGAEPIDMADVPGVEITENDEFTGTDGDDVYDLGRGADAVDGGDGNDRMLGGGGGDALSGGNGADRLAGDAGDDQLDGGGGRDRLLGGKGDDALDGGDGNDRMLGHAGDDLLRGGAGDDRLEGRRGDDVLRGGEDDDMLLGGAGDDMLFGGGGDDVLESGSGFDVLRGGGGDDRLIASEGTVARINGMEGADVIELIAPGRVVVRGFETGVDTLDMSGFSARASTLEALEGMARETAGGGVRFVDGAGARAFVADVTLEALMESVTMRDEGLL